MRRTLMVSLATVSLGGGMVLAPGLAYSAPLGVEPSSDIEEQSDTAVMGPAQEYQHGLTVNGVAPTLRSVVVNEESILAYCIEYWVQAADPDHESAVTGWEDFTGDNNFKTDPQVRKNVAWILRNSYPTLELAELSENAGVNHLTEAEAISAVRLGSSWSGTGWHDRYWSFHRVNVTLISAGPVGGALVKTCPFTGWSAGTIRPTSGDLIRRLSTVDHGVTHHSAVPM